MKASAFLSFKPLVLVALIGLLVSPLLSSVLSAAPERKAQDVEDCVACRYIWLQVEMDVGNSQIEENIYDSFTQNCIEAQKAPIFYPACQDMFDGQTQTHTTDGRRAPIERAIAEPFLAWVWSSVCWWLTLLLLLLRPPSSSPGIDDMIGDYMDGYTVNQVCENARLCR